MAEVVQPVQVTTSGSGLHEFHRSHTRGYREMLGYNMVGFPSGFVVFALHEDLLSANPPAFSRDEEINEPFLWWKLIRFTPDSLKHCNFIDSAVDGTY